MYYGFKTFPNYILQRIVDLDELYYAGTDENLLVKKLKSLLFAYSILKNEGNNSIYEERIYLLYSGIVDDILSISEIEELDNYVQSIGLLTLNEYFTKKELIRSLKNWL